jgi:type IV secretion system protein VirB10
MVNSISTRTAQEGDYIYMRTASPISAEGRIIVPVNSYVQGVVTYTKRAGKVKGKAELAIRLETLTLPRGEVLEFTPLLDSLDHQGTGQKVDKEENVVRQGPDHGRDAKQIAILAGSGASIGGIVDQSWKGAGIGAGVGAGVGLATVLLTRGKDVQLSQGTSLDVVLDRPVLLNRPRLEARP